MRQGKRLQSIAAFRINGVSLRGLYPRYTLPSVLLRHLPPMEPSAADRLWSDASVRRNTTAKQMTPFGVFREGCGRSTVMHLPSRKAGSFCVQTVSLGLLRELRSLRTGFEQVAFYVIMRPVRQ